MALYLTDVSSEILCGHHFDPVLAVRVPVTSLQFRSGEEEEENGKEEEEEAS